MTAVDTLTITDPGVYDIPEDIYHADPVPGGSLSCSEARRLLDCPAKFRYAKVHGQEHKDTFDFGKAAHALVLGVGAEVVVCEFDDWRTKDAKAMRDEARAAGATPVLASDWQIVEDMALELRRHPLAARLLDLDHGKAEQSMFWRDSDTGIMLRSRLDILPPIPETGRLIVPDYKTAASAEPRAFGRAVGDYGYHQQAAWYLEGIAAVHEVHDAAFLFVVQEKRPPYVVSVFELDSLALSIGEERNRRAIDLYTECMVSGVWPAYTDSVSLVSLPRYIEFQHAEEYHP